MKTIRRRPVRDQLFQSNSLSSIFVHPIQSRLSFITFVENLITMIIFKLIKLFELGLKTNKKHRVLGIQLQVTVRKPFRWHIESSKLFNCLHFGALCLNNTVKSSRMSSKIDLFACFSVLETQVLSKKTNVYSHLSH